MYPGDPLADWLALRNINSATLVKHFHLKPVHIRQNALYGHVSHLIEFYQPETMPGHVYFQGNDFFLLYVSEPDYTLEDLQSAPLLALSQPETLRSRAGKNNRQLIYAEQGAAVSADIIDGSVDFVEIFLPMTLAEYRASLYIEPGIFYK